MAMLNIPTSVVDPAYRYTMPRLISKKESSGKGRKTCIMNMGDVAGALKRSPAYIVKFFGYELGTITSYTNKEGEGERTIIKGHVDTEIFQDLLDTFINKYVLCKECHYPEIDMVVNRKGTIMATCKACGWDGELDNMHKVAAFIAKNPPDSGIGFGAEKKGKKSKDDKRADKLHNQRNRKKLETEGDECNETKEEADADADETVSEVKAEKNNTKFKNDKQDTTDAQKSKKNDKGHADDDSADEDGNMKKGTNHKKDKKDQSDKKDKQAKNYKKNKKDKNCNKAKKEAESEEASVSDGEQGAMEYGHEGLTIVVADLVAFLAKKDGDPTVENFFEEVRVLQVIKAFDNKLRMYVVLSALFPDGAMDAKGVSDKKAYVERFIANGTMEFSEWIWGFDAYLASSDKAVRGFPMVLKALYDADIAEEEDILAHYRASKDTPGFEVAQKAVTGLLAWLETADEDDSESGDEDADSDRMD